MIDQFHGGADEEPGASRARQLIVAALVMLVVLVSAAGWYLLRPPAADGTTAAGARLRFAITDEVVDSLAVAPAGVRVKVRVLNATDTRGLARRATLMLRELGYDVVDFDGAGKDRRQRSAIISHTGHADWAERLQRAMGVPTVEVSADSSRYVDFTVLLGSDWQPPAKTLRP